MAYFVINQNCNGCLACLQNCPANAIDVRDVSEIRTLLHNMARCARCGTCWRICPQEAIEFKHMLQNQWDTVAELDLVHCRVCGQVLYTAALGDTLDKKTGRLPDAYCEAHREAIALKIKAHFPDRPDLAVEPAPRSKP